MIWIVFYLFFPALVIYLCEKYPLFHRIGPVVTCYLSGLLLGNTGILPPGIGKTHQILLTATIPLALPLIFFSLDIKKWARLAGKSLLAFGLQVAAVMAAVAAGYLWFREPIGPESWKAAGMLIGVYTGGTPNLAAIGTALQINPSVYLAIHAADVLAGSLYILLAITFLKPILKLILPPFLSSGNAVNEEVRQFDSYEGIFSRESLLPLAKACGLSLLIFAVGGGITLAFPQSYSMVVAILAISSLGIASSLVPAIRRIPMTFQAGQYLILIFCLTVSSMANLSSLLTTAPAAIGFVFAATFGALFIHMLLCALFRIDADTAIITSAAGILSPPFVPMVAASLKNREVIISGVITGVIGWVIGTYLGIAVAYLLRSV
ncbi:MAG: DUF819 family protein [Smithellaceae bacterium]|nr:DUF819 family protein [Smithellaceae bacterium]